jgi:hypothetical protein
MIRNERGVPAVSPIAPGRRPRLRRSDAPDRRQAAPRRSAEIQMLEKCVCQLAGGVPHQPQTLQTPDRVERELREASIRNALALAASVMRSPTWSVNDHESRPPQAEPETE